MKTGRRAHGDNSLRSALGRDLCESFVRENIFYNIPAAFVKYVFYVGAPEAVLPNEKTAGASAPCRLERKLYSLGKKQPFALSVF